MSMRYPISLLLISFFFLSGCSTNAVKETKGKAFHGMYEEKPKSLLVLPPINESTDADAKLYYSTTVEVPFAQHGFYVFPEKITSDVLKQEGIYDAELLINLPLNKFKDFFGADDVLFTTIKRWDLQYTVLTSKLTVELEAAIKSTSTNQILWKYGGIIEQNLTSSDGGLVANLISTAISSALADYTEYAQRLNYRIVSTSPVGPYHPVYMKDQEQIVIIPAK